jgi:DNA-directed RNA polymerase subunit M/transcription elongation factor TFIIS
MSSLRFACPRCRSVLEAPIHKAGEKVPCPKCGQRLQVPGPTREKTVLADALPESMNRAAARGAPPVRTSAPLTIAVACPGCGRRILLPEEKLGAVIECAKCDTRFVAGGGREELPSHPARALAPPAGDLRGAPAGSGLPIGLGIAAIVVAALGGLLSFMPILWFFALPVSGVALTLGLLALAFAASRGGLPVAVVAVLLAAIALGYAIDQSVQFRQALNRIFGR